MARQRRTNGSIQVNEVELYLTTIVEPTIKDFEAAPTSRRHAFLACVAVYHTIDYMFPGKTGNPEHRFRIASPDFDLVYRVAHAFKHVTSDGRQPLPEKDVIVRPSGGIGSFAIGLSRIGDTEGGVTIEKELDQDILSSLKLSVEFLKNQLVDVRTLVQRPAM